MIGLNSLPKMKNGYSEPGGITVCCKSDNPYHQYDDGASAATLSWLTSTFANENVIIVQLLHLFGTDGIANTYYPFRVATCLHYGKYRQDLKFI